MQQFLDWIAGQRRTYAQAMDTWKTSCPRLSVWEDAIAGGLIELEPGSQSPQAPILVTAKGRAVLNATKPSQS